MTGSSSTKLLVYVDVRNEDGVYVNDAIKEILSGLPSGDKITFQKRFSAKAKPVLIWTRGDLQIYNAARDAGLRIVSSRWVEKCKEVGDWSHIPLKGEQAKDFQVTTDDTSISSSALLNVKKGKKRASMEPITDEAAKMPSVDDACFHSSQRSDPVPTGQVNPNKKHNSNKRHKPAKKSPSPRTSQGSTGTLHEEEVEGSVTDTEDQHHHQDIAQDNTKPRALSPDPDHNAHQDEDDPEQDMMDVDPEAAVPNVSSSVLSPDPTSEVQEASTEPPRKSTITPFAASSSGGGGMDDTFRPPYGSASSSGTGGGSGSRKGGRRYSSAADMCCQDEDDLNDDQEAFYPAMQHEEEQPFQPSPPAVAPTTKGRKASSKKSAKASSVSEAVDDEEATAQEDSSWACGCCTAMNKPRARACFVCKAKKGDQAPKATVSSDEKTSGTAAGDGKPKAKAGRKGAKGSDKKEAEEVGEQQQGEGATGGGRRKKKASVDVDGSKGKGGKENGPEQAHAEQDDVKPGSAKTAGKHIGISGMDGDERKETIKLIRQISKKEPEATHVVTSDDHSVLCTHLVVPPDRECRRTLKVLFALARGHWIVTSDWVQASRMEDGGFLDEAEYTTSKYGPRGEDRSQLLKGEMVFLGPSRNPQPYHLKQLVKVVGGTIVNSLTQATMVLLPSDQKASQWLKENLEDKKKKTESTSASSNHLRGLIKKGAVKSHVFLFDSIEKGTRQTKNVNDDGEPYVLGKEEL